MSVKSQINQKLRINGKGKSKQEAFADALSKIQKQVIKNNDDVILQIQPKDVTVLAATEDRYTEKFLFFFMPRVRSTFTVDLEITVEIQKVRMADVPFQLTEGSDPNGIAIPFTTKKA